MKEEELFWRSFFVVPGIVIGLALSMLLRSVGSFWWLYILLIVGGAWLMKFGHRRMNQARKKTGKDPVPFFYWPTKEEEDYVPPTFLLFVFLPFLLIIVLTWIFL
ncbi:hypothetical protein [Alteribacillus iranensis]|uniref:DUF3899 domain-containing protein n=1 Tax=Alteribacillus iranensis TaxID=930128 RepID=A0A1I2FJC6_9BACI|nr:hypothetical protein [Alteribacillus iranensis]SFF04720.1 hypothetical protein SAMN05192532_11232 [Alteribacillus iranensis]